MGGGNVKQSPLKKNEIVDFQNLTYLPEEIITNLYRQFEHFSSSIRDDGVLDYQEFCAIIGRSPNILNRKMFDSVDLNRDGRINFKEFLKLLSCFINGCKDDQINLSYKIFADSETNEIDRENMLALIKSSLTDESSIRDIFDDEAISSIIEDTFSVFETDIINYENYSHVLVKHMDIISWLKVDVNKFTDNHIIRGGCGIGVRKKK